MKYIKKYEERWYTNINNIGEIIKRSTYDDKNYVLYMITDINLKENIIKAIYIGYSSLDFEGIKLKYNKELGVETINRWFKDDYNKLNIDESNRLIKAIKLYNNDYYFDYIKSLTNIDLRDYVIRHNMNKYNL